MSTLIGCGNVGCVVGAEALSGAASGVWVKTRVYREGHFLCATVYSVAAGEPKIVELRVDMRPIAREVMKAHLALHGGQLARIAGRSEALIGWGLGSLWKGAKKAAKAIGRNKLVKGVVKVSKAVAKGAKAVVKSKALGVVLTAASVFPITAPFAAPALGAYAAANAALAGVEAGSKVVKTAQKAASTIKQGAKLAKQVAKTTKSTANAVKKAGAMLPKAQKLAIVKRTQAAGKIKLNAKGKRALATTLVKAPAGKARKAVASKVASKMKQLATIKSRAALAKVPPDGSAR